MVGDQEPIRIPRGTADLTGIALAGVDAVESAAREVFRRFGYREIRGPIFEETRLFARAIGEATDVVEKEMFTIPRKGGSYSLRPEATASVVRHYIENSLHREAPFRKFFYVGPMFRHERPQAGRHRQFHQVGIEALGSLDPLLDVEVILALDELLRALSLDGHEVRLNTIGSTEARPRVKKLLLDALKTRRRELCPDCRRRMERNVFRVLDCKVPTCRAVVADLPRIEDLVDEESRRHYERVQDALARSGVPFRSDPFLVRGLDYYTRTVFEIVHPSLGAQDAVCGGGRYDGLVEELGGPAVPAVGFALGVERLLLALEELDRSPEVKEEGLDGWVVAVREDGRAPAFDLALLLRREGLAVDLDYEGRGLKAQMKKAARANARFALILGPDEIARDAVTLRNMETGEQEDLPRRAAVRRLLQLR